LNILFLSHYRGAWELKRLNFVICSHTGTITGRLEEEKEEKKKEKKENDLPIDA
jgi:hypothetical protein